jgi:tripartite-type tricarboxylate transporter receptor subunit TctC
MMRINFLLLFILAISITLSSGLSNAQVDYPTKPIQVLIGYAAGGSTDVLIRALVQEAKKYLGQEVIIVNKPGAGGTVAVTHVGTAKPDGYTLGATPSSSNTVAPFLLEIPIDPVKDITPILSFAKFNVGILVKSDSPFKKLKDLLEYAKQNPNKATYGHPGVSTRPHLVMEMIVLQDGVKMNFVAFPGDIPTITALLGGHIMSAGCSAAGWISHVQAGTLRLLAVMEEERMDPFPEIPTIVELGYPYPLPLVVFLYGPKGISEPIVKKLAEAFDKASQSPTYKKVAIENALYTKKNMFPEDLGKFLDSEKTKTGDIIKRLGLGKK